MGARTCSRRWRKSLRSSESRKTGRSKSPSSSLCRNRASMADSSLKWETKAAYRPLCGAASVYAAVAVFPWATEFAIAGASVPSSLLVASASRPLPGEGSPSPRSSVEGRRFGCCCSGGSSRDVVACRASPVGRMVGWRLRLMVLFARRVKELAAGASSAALSSTVSAPTGARCWAGKGGCGATPLLV